MTFYYDVCMYGWMYFAADINDDDVIWDFQICLAAYYLPEFTF